MKKDTIILLCTPDSDRLMYKRCMGSLKTSNIERAELFIFENNYDPDFRHAVIMEKMLRYAERRKMNLVFLDDDAETTCYSWLDRLYEVSDDLDADIVSCIQTYDTGAINNIAHTAGITGRTFTIKDFQHYPENVVNDAVYVPTLCSSIMLIRNPGRYTMDAGYQKYLLDHDICMQAWEQGQKVAVALDLKMIHSVGSTGNLNPNRLEIDQQDAKYFAEKWKDKIQRLFDKKELRQYKDFFSRPKWRDLYGNATNMITFDQDHAIGIFSEIAEYCPIIELKAGANYYLYNLTKDLEYLKKCNELNPCHRKARELLIEAGGQAVSKCRNINNCMTCHFKPNAPLISQVTALIQAHLK